jgi:hypothetical protein
MISSELVSDCIRQKMKRQITLFVNINDEHSMAQTSFETSFFGIYRIRFVIGVLAAMRQLLLGALGAGRWKMEGGQWCWRVSAGGKTKWFTAISICYLLFQSGKGMNVCWVSI